MGGSSEGTGGHHGKPQTLQPKRDPVIAAAPNNPPSYCPTYTKARQVCAPGTWLSPSWLCCTNFLCPWVPQGWGRHRIRDHPSSPMVVEKYQ